MSKNYNTTDETYKKIVEGSRKGGETNHNNKINRIIEYIDNPVKCKNCGKSLPYEKRKNSFCSRNCWFEFGNPVKIKNSKGKKKDVCPQCGKIFDRIHKNNVYCSRDCFLESRKVRLNKKFSEGKMKDDQARNYYREITEKVCSICGLSMWNGLPIPLNVDHIDGNSENNFPSNFRFICLNCDGQSKTYGNRNIGNGRKNRRKNK